MLRYLLACAVAVAAADTVAPNDVASAATVPKYRLHYFPFRFRAEPARLMFHYKGVPFDDYLVQKVDWPKLKPTYPNQQMPLLEIGERNITQSLAIFRYLGDVFKMVGNDSFDRAHIDEIGELFRECVDKCTPYVLVDIGLREGNATQLHDTVFVPAIQQYAPILERHLNTSSSGYFSPSGISWVDFYVAGQIRTYSLRDTALLNNYPTLMAHNDRIYQLPELKEYFAKNPPGKF